MQLLQLQPQPQTKDQTERQQLQQPAPQHHSLEPELGKPLPFNRQSCQAEQQQQGQRRSSQQGNGDQAWRPGPFGKHAGKKQRSRPARLGRDPEDGPDKGQFNYPTWKIGF